MIFYNPQVNKVHTTRSKLARCKATSLLARNAEDFSNFTLKYIVHCVSRSKKGRDGKLPGTVSLLSWLQDR